VLPALLATYRYPLLELLATKRTLLLECNPLLELLATKGTLPFEFNATPPALPNPEAKLQSAVPVFAISPHPCLPDSPMHTHTLQPISQTIWQGTLIHSLTHTHAPS
jgi:hypothetical protein